MASVSRRNTLACSSSASAAADHDGAEQATPAPTDDPATVTYKTVGTQPEATTLELFHTYSKRKFALSLAEQYMNIHPPYTAGDIILKSSDDVGFKVSLASLGERSTFFKDLADLPRPEDSSNSKAANSAKTLEVLLSVLRPGNKDILVPSVAVLDELVDVVDAFDFNMDTYHHTVFGSDLNIGIKYAFAFAYPECDIAYWEEEILETGSSYNYETWHRCPEARQELRHLMQ